MIAHLSATCSGIRRTSPPPCVTPRSFLIALSDQPERLVPHWQIVDKMWDAYIRVDDVDAIYAEVQERGAGIDYTIYDAPHGFREFGVQDPDGHDIAFGQRLEA